MDFVTYLASNIPLFCISIVMLFISVRNLKIRKWESILFIVFTALVLYLSIVIAMETLAKNTGNVILGTIFTSTGYIVRPILLFIFVLLANMGRKKTKLFYLLCFIPIAVNTLICLFPLFFGVPGLSTIFFYYKALEDGTAIFVRGGFLNYFPHLISVIYLGLLVYISTVHFQGKHRRDGFVLLFCVFFIAITVVTEVLTRRSDLLNIVCEICAMVNYIFIMSVNTSKDVLTQLYDRRTYYEDSARYHSSINGVIQIDMNGLKYLNDNFGHAVGDEALVNVASIFTDSIDKQTMCAYRLSGDEFLVLMIDGKEESLNQTAQLIREKIDASPYSAAIGTFFIPPKSDITFEEAMHKAEELMYEDKENYYADKEHDRRRLTK